MKLKLKILAIALLLASCSNNEKTTSADAQKGVFDIVESSPLCAKYSWKNRGRAPMGYIRGVSLMYAKQVCGQGSDFIKPNKITGRNSIQAMKDALRYYNLGGSQLNTYTFLLGLGMRESSGKYCEGRDRSANFVKANSAEAGLYQTAYVSRVFNKELKPLYEKYTSGNTDCELTLFSEKVTCSKYNAINHGVGDGVAWQELTKKCPAFAVQWAAILIRSNYRHFGPIKRREVEFKIQCKDMLLRVEKFASKNCSSLR